MRRPLIRRPLILGAWTTVILLGVAMAALVGRAQVSRHFADADDDALVVHGKDLYAHNCASCHGRFLQGQPLWQLVDEYAGRRAPAHDQTGHTWQHSDEDLFGFTKYARWTRSDPATPYMPAFESKLDDADIVAVVAFMKRSWPLGLRVSQAMLNPGRAGMPANASSVEWRLPPTTCRGAAAAQQLR